MAAKEEEDLATLLVEMDGESDRGLALVALSAIDDQLRLVLAAFMLEDRRTIDLLEGRNAALGTLAARISACLSLGLIEPLEFDEIETLRKIRNRFAHDLTGASFSNDTVRQLCSNLKSPLPGWRDDLASDARFRFKNAASAIMTRLVYRPHWVRLERRESRVWIDPEKLRWKSVAEEPVPLDRAKVLLVGGTIKLGRSMQKPGESDAEDRDP